MDVREKLVELLRNAKAAMKSENLSCDIARNMFVVDFMISHGVTVQEWVSGEGPCAEQKPRTNAERIRAMSDEELAKFIDDIAQSVADGEYCTLFLNVKNFPYSCEDTKKACVAHVVEWLRQPAEGE